MDLIYDLDKEFLVTKPGASSKLTRGDTKRGDVRSITVTFVRGSVVVVPPGAMVEMIFVAKRSTSQASPPILLTNSWTFNPTLTRWEGIVTQDSARILDILSSSTTTSLLAEFSFTTDEIGPLSSQIFTISLENDVWKGSEGTPLSLPSPLEWLETNTAPLRRTSPPIDGITQGCGLLTAFSGNHNDLLFVQNDKLGLISVRIYQPSDPSIPPPYSSFDTVNRVLHVLSPATALAVRDEINGNPAVSPYVTCSLAPGNHGRGMVGELPETKFGGVVAANHTISISTTSNFSHSGGSTAWVDDRFILNDALDAVTGARRWVKSAGGRIYWDGGYWYIYSEGFFGTIILRAAGTINDNPETLNYSHAPGSSASGGVITKTAILGFKNPVLGTAGKLSQTCLVNTTNGSGKFEDAFRCVSVSPFSWIPTGNVFRDRSTGVYYRTFFSLGQPDTELAYP